jgi:hypothetical protein
MRNRQLNSVLNGFQNLMALDDIDNARRPRRRVRIGQRNQFTGFVL